MSSLIASVPQAFADIWYVYDLMLVAVIVVCVLLLIFIRKRSNLAEAAKSLKSARNILRKARSVSPRKRRLLLFTAKNILESAAYYYSVCIGEEDKYEYVKLVETIRAASARVETLMKTDLQKPAQEFAGAVDSILEHLSDKA